MEMKQDIHLRSLVINMKINYDTLMEEEIKNLDGRKTLLLHSCCGPCSTTCIERLNKYLTRKVGEIAKAGANVIFERGLWSSKDRKEIKEYYKNNGVDCEIHYVCVDDDTWKHNIEERNQRVLDGNGGSDFYLDEGLMKKLESKWEEPTEDEYDILYKVER